MLLKQPLKQNIAKRILLSFFLFSFILTALSTAVILYSQYTKEKTEVFTHTRTLIDARVEFIGEVLWNMDTPLAELSIKSLADNPNITYIVITDENKKIITSVGDVNSRFSKTVEVPLLHQSQMNNTKSKVGTLIANLTTATAQQHLKDNFINIMVVQGLKSIVMSIIFLFLIYNILVKHLNKITNTILSNSLDNNNAHEFISLNRTHRNDELQLLADTLNKNQIIKSKHFKKLNKEKDKLTKEITFRKEAEHKALNSHEELLYVLNSLTTAVYLCKHDGEVLFMNHKALNLLSQRDSILASSDSQQYLYNIVRFNKEDDICSTAIDIAEYVSSSKFISSLNAYCVSNDGQELLTPVELTIIPTKQNTPLLEPNFIVVAKDKSGEAKLEEMSYIVSHDYLTKVRNRMYLSEQIEEVLSKGSENYSLAIIDLDKFKAVNDTCGHRAGDQLLKLVADTITKSLGRNDILARIGGDEFAILFNSNPQSSSKISFRIIADLEGLDFTYDGKLLPISCSIGITDLRADDEKLETVMTRADAACYEIKRNGKGSVGIYKDKVADINSARVYRLK